MPFSELISSPSSGLNLAPAVRTRPIRFGLIGVGGIGSCHCAAIRKLEEAGMVKLVAVADPMVERLAAEKNTMEAHGVRWHLDYRDMLQREDDLDAVAIAAPIHYHYEMALTCIERGLYVHLEKPPTPLIDQLDELIEADRYGKVSVGFQMIGAYCLQALKKIVFEGMLGEIISIRSGCCWPRTDRYYNRAPWAGRMMLGKDPVFDGPATNAMAHVVHNIMYLAGEGRHSAAIPVEVKGELYRAREIESYDTAFIGGAFDSGIEFGAALTHATREELPFEIKVNGAKGWAWLSQDGARLESSVGISCYKNQSTQELINISYSNFLDVVVGKQKRFNTCLRDARGYVMATNGMLISSGGVHTIAPAHSGKYGEGEGAGFDVAGLRVAVERTVCTGKSFSGQGLPWASARLNHFPLYHSEDLGKLAGQRLNGGHCNGALPKGIKH